MVKSFDVVMDANRRDNKIAAIHIGGCHALERDLRNGAYTVQVEGTLRDALDVAVDAEDRRIGYTDDDARVYPCAREE